MYTSTICGTSPCPCMSTQKGSMILAIVDAVVGIGNLALMIVALVTYIKHDSKDQELTKSERTIGIITIVILTIMCILQVLLAFRLYFGAKKRDYRNCRIWIIITIITTIINLVSVMLAAVAGDFRDNGLASYAGALFSLVYKIYEICVVWWFIRELKLEALGVSPNFTTAVLQGSGVGAMAQQQVYVTPVSRDTYPMQQYASYPPPYPVTTNQHYPAPIHHVTSGTTP